jgi:hypothetical protein
MNFNDSAAVLPIFPPLRGNPLIRQDFFKEGIPFFEKKFRY